MLGDMYSAVIEKASPDDSRRALGLLVLLNLADLNATMTNGLTEERVAMILKDWHHVDAILRGRPGSHADFAGLLLDGATSPESATERVARLFVASLMRATNYQKMVLVREHVSWLPNY